MKYIFFFVGCFVCLELCAQSDNATFSTGQIDNGKMAFSEDGQFLAVLSGNKQVNIFKAETQLISNSIELNDLKEVHEITFGEGNDVFVSGKIKTKYVIKKLDASSGVDSIIFEIPSQITGLAFDKKNKTVYTSDADGNIRSIDSESGKENWIKKAHEGHALDVAYSKVSKLLISSGSDGSVMIFDNDGNEIQSVPISQEWVREVNLSLNGNTIIAGTDDGLLFSIFPDVQYAVEQIPIDALNGYVSEIVMTPDDNGFVVSSSLGEVVIWSSKKNSLLKRYKEKTSKTIKGLAFNPNGRSIYTSSSGSKNLISYDVSVLGIVPKFRYKDEEDKTAPSLFIAQPANTSSGRVNFSEDLIKISGSAIDESGIHRLKINGRETPLKESGNFTIVLPLQMGENFVTIECDDLNGNTAIKRFIVNRKNLTGEKYDPAKARNYLFIVGVNDYEYWPKLFNAVKDAEDVASTLVGIYDFNFSDVKMLLNEQATINNIYAELAKYVEKISPQDNIVIYYSGHGHYDQILNEGYWIPYDANLSSPGEYFSNSTLLKILNNFNSQHIFLVVDACFSGSLFAASSRGYTDNVEKYKSRWGLASGRLETVSDGAYGSNSPFATKFIDYLRSNTAEEFAVSELIQFVKIEVANENKQTPIGNPLKNIGDEGGEFIFRKKNSK